MSKMKELYTDITNLLETTRLNCEEIAKRVGCPVSYVNEIVEERWNQIDEFFATQ